MDGLDPYAVLKLENGEAATDAEIRKVRTQRPRSTGGSAHDPPRENPDAEARDVGATQAYRKRALDCHPDKQPDPKLKKGACDSPSSSERSCGC